MNKIHVDSLIRTRRRTVALVITRDARLIVRAPLHTPVAYIDGLIIQKSAWIRRTMDEMKNRPVPPQRTFVNGEEFLFLGNPYHLEIIEENGQDIELMDRLYISRKILPDIRKRLKQWYQMQANNHVIERCAWYSMLTGYTPESIHITDARRRWGSCSSKGTLNFSWRIIMAPREVVDYIIVHELVHLDQPDHSRDFWQKVEKIMPDYTIRKEWLRENAHLLTW
jgi:predicted metal-dependent hydrolase